MCGFSSTGTLSICVMNLPCPHSNKAEDRSIMALKRCAHDFACQQMTHDSYDDDQEDEYYRDLLAISQMIVQ
jgi:hypothetical protein